MAWIEQTGTSSWRVRYPRPAGGCGSVSGFNSRKAARDYADDLESDRRRGRWLDPDDAKTVVTAWAGRWVERLMWRRGPRRTTREYPRRGSAPRLAAETPTILPDVV